MFHLLRDRSFLSLALTQFLGVFNDNAFKQFVLLLAVSGGVAWLGESEWVRAWGPSLGQALFALPFLMTSLWAGALADRVSKSRIIRGAKLAEVGVMALAGLGLLLGNFPLLLASLFLMGLQSALYGPSRYGAIPELILERDLSRGNGLIQMTSFLAMLGGILVGGLLLDAYAGAGPGPAPLFLGVAALGVLASLGIRHLPAAAPGSRPRLDALSVARRSLREARRDRPLLLAILAGGMFWLIASALLLSINEYGTWLGLRGSETSLRLAALTVGVAAGSLLAGRLSGDKVETGFVPMGLAGMAAALFAAAFLARSAGWFSGSLLAAGFSAGFFSVPIRALIQQRARPDRRGAVLGLSEVADYTGVLLAAGLHALLVGVLGLDPPALFAVLGGLLLAFTAASLVWTAEFAIRLGALTLVRAIWRVRVRGAENLPARGGALIVSNHLSLADAVLISAASPRPVRFLMYRPFFEIPVLGAFCRLMKTIPIASTDGHKEKLRSLRLAAQRVARGELVCIFAEGSISRSGALLPFARGLEKIARTAGAPIVPACLDGVWGSLFSYSAGRIPWKRPRRIPCPVHVAFGAPLPPESSRHEVRAAVQELSAVAREERAGESGSLPRRFLASARRHARRTAVVDSTGTRLSFRRLLAGSLILRSLLAKRLGDGPNVGVLLPPGAGSTLANLALSLDGRVPVNLNYTLGPKGLESPIRQAGLARVITSRRFLEALGRGASEAPPGSIALEDLMGEAGRGRRLLWLLATLLPARLLARLLALPADGRGTATILFSSGSTGEPKGVVLSHGNVLANLEAVETVFDLRAGEAVLGVLPHFHGFGYTAALWLPLLTGATAACCPDPFDARGVGRLCAAERVGLMIGTPAFFRAWLRRCRSEELASVRLAVVGAEKLPRDLARRWEESFGLALLEGYGCTELSPVVSVNVPDRELDGWRELGHKPGTVGRPLPGVAVRVVDPEGGAPREPGEEGLILVRGAGVMQGYLERPDLTAGVMRDGWYVTGDIGRVDADGFLELTDRLSRFSKIGGEMVPHGRVEEELSQTLAELHARLAEEEGGEPAELFVTSLPDERKGERLVVVHTPLAVSAREILDGSRARGLPALFLPREGCFVEVEAIPRLGTGKVDLAGLRRVAAERLPTAP